MRLMFCNHNLQMTRDILIAIAKRVPIESVDVIEGPDFTPPPGIPCNYFSREELYFRNYDVDWSKIMPVDQQIADSLLHADVYGYTMFSRYEKYSNVVRWMRSVQAQGRQIRLANLNSHITRKFAFLRHLRFWYDRIAKRRPDAMIHVYASPHLLVEYIIWQICKVFGIPSVWLTVTQIHPKILITTDLAVFEGDLKARVDYHVAQWHKTGQVPDVDIHVQRYLDAQYHPTIDPKPKYVDRAHIMASRGRIYESPSLSRVVRAKIVIKDCLDALLRRHSFRYVWLKYKTYLDLMRADTEIEQRYERLSMQPDFTQNYIYFPLHTTPEEATSPVGGVFEHQILVAEMISYHLPPGWKLYVKEHPVQSSYGREHYLYEEMTKLPNVSLISRDANTFELTRNCRAAATIYGSVTLEALARSKPVLVFGDAFYIAASGTFRIKTNDDCQRAIRKIQAGDYEATPETFRCFLRGIQDCAIDAWLPNFGVQMAEGFPQYEQSVERIADAFISAIRSQKAKAEKQTASA